MSDAPFVDASAPFLRFDDGKTILFKTTSADTWFHASTSARMAKSADNRFVLSLLRRRQRSEVSPGSDRTVTTGGVLAAQVHLVALAASPVDEAVWTEALRRHGHTPSTSKGFAFLPLPLWKGRMTVGGIQALVVNAAAYQGVMIGTPTSSPVTLRLNAQGADAFRTVIDSGIGPPVVVRFDYEYDTLVPGSRYLVTADARAAHAVFSRHRSAVAGYYGMSGSQEGLDALCDELRDVGAAAVSWERIPDGFDTARLAVMERAILHRWAKKALDQLVESVEPDPDAPANGTGGIVVNLKERTKIENLDLSARHDGQRFARESFSFSINLGQLHDLRPATYAVDVEDDATVPIILNFGRDPRVRHYICHVGYRNSDGTVTVASHEGSGQDGMSVSDTIRWGSGEPRPERVEVRYSIEWTDLQWEGHTGEAVLTTDVPCVTFSVSPAARIAEVVLVSDLASAQPGSLAAVNWRTESPPIGDLRPKNYTGSFIVEGTGATGQLVRELMSFPYPEGREARSIFEWTVDLAQPDGTVLSGREAFSLADKTEASIFIAGLRPA